MRLEDIRNMETAPFDEEVLENIYYGGYAASASMQDGFAVLVFQYLIKFDERYGTKLAEGVDMVQILPDDIAEMDEMVWYENIGYVIDKAMDQGGWHMEWLSMDPDEFHGILEKVESTGNTEKAVHEAYRQFLDGYYADCFVKACLLQEEKEIYDTVCCLEENEVAILWNSRLERYRQYRRENEEVVRAVCPEEDSFISVLQRGIWEPYVAAYVQKTAEHEGMTYGVVVLGCDGYNYYSSNDINPNWILRAVKLGLMLELAWEKIDCYENMKRGGKAA